MADPPPVPDGLTTCTNCGNALVPGPGNRRAVGKRLLVHEWSGLVVCVQRRTYRTYVQPDGKAATARRTV